MSDLIGQSLGRYHILEQLGEGGMATVYKAFDTRLERDVAVKVIRKSAFSSEVLERMLKRFEREAKALARLTHPNIVGVIDYGEFEGSPYLVMPYLPSGTLKQRLGKPIPWQDAARILLPIARALQFAHDQGIIHRDVKPSNILITLSGEPMLTDFGIAKILENDEGTALTSTGMGVGTPEYMAPEQWTGNVSPQSDIYALGVVFYEMVTGRKPYIADTPPAIMLKQATEPLPSPVKFMPNLPEKVEKVILKALAKQPENRYSDMHAFAEALEKVGLEYITGQGEGDERATQDLIEAGKTGQRHKPKLPMRRWLPIVGIIAFTCLVLAMVGGYLVWKNIFPMQTTMPTDVLSTPSNNNTLSISLTPILSHPLDLTPTASLNVTPTPVFTSLPDIGSTQISPADGMVMVYIPEGDFSMGNPAEEALANCWRFRSDCQLSWFTDEEPTHRVFLNAYWIDQNEVTNEMYAQCVQDGSCAIPRKTGSALRGSYYGDSRYQNYPVIYVNWNDSKTYCQWAGRRLPTEAEWEKAAKGPNGSIYPWGNGDPKSDLLNYKGNIGDTTSGGNFPAGASYYQVFDMAGNVWEWVADWYGDNYYSQSLDQNPTGPATGNKRIIRGGAWVEMSDEGDIRTTARASGGPDSANNYIGFRCVQDISP